MILSFSIFGRKIQISPASRDHILITLWMLVTFKQFKFDELILYPLALYFLWAFVRDFPLLVDLIARSLILWAFPIWWLLSMSWGIAPGEILKSGLQLVLTVMICYCAVVRLTPRQIMLSLLIAAGWFGILSILNSPSGGISARGVFSSKNALGIAMVMLWVAALCTALDGGLPRWTRLAAAGAALLSLYLIQIANSATAVLLALAALMIILTLRGRTLVSGPALLTVTVFMGGAAAMLGASIAFAVPEFDPINQVLGAFGKDMTLTGRTVLWRYAGEEVARNPFLGVGQGGFWTPEDALSRARRIYVEFHKPTHASFSFHSSFFEIAVHQGLVGLGIVVAASLWCLWRIVLTAIFETSMPAIFFVCISLITLVQSFTETGLMAPFALLSMLFVMGALMTLKHQKRQPGH